MKNKLMIAPAGAGKTTYLINEALKQTEDVLILTYTKTNLAAMKAKICELKGEIPENIHIQAWDEYRQNPKEYAKIYLDEMQDLAGYNLVFLEELLQSGQEMLLFADPRQVTAGVQIEAKYRRYGEGAVEEFIRKRCSEICEIDKETLSASYRMNSKICTFASFLYEKYGEITSQQTEVTGHDGVFLVNESDVGEYLKEYAPLQLRNRRTIKIHEEYPWKMIADTKGEEYDRVLLYPTSRMLSWMINHNNDIQKRYRENFYQALTRARYSVGIVYDYDDQTHIEGAEKYK